MDLEPSGVIPSNQVPSDVLDLQANDPADWEL